MAIPSWVLSGTAVNSTTAVSVAWPAGHRVGDVGLLIVETANERATLTTASGFIEVTSNGTGTAGATNAAALQLYWQRATNTAMANAGFSDPGDHILGQIVVFRGCIATGNPWNGVQTEVVATATTAVSVGSITTTVASAMVVAIVANDTDTATAQTTGWAASGLAVPTIKEFADSNTTAGAGGGFGVAGGGLETPGPSGAITATLANAALQVHILIPLIPDPPIHVEDDEGWWGGAMKCFAPLALAGTLAASALSGQCGIQQMAQGATDEYPTPVVALNSGPSTGFFKPLSFQNTSVRYAWDQDEVPTAPVVTAVEEEYWQNPAPSATPAVWPAPWAGDQQEIVNPLEVEEEYWQNSVPPQPLTFRVPAPSAWAQHEIVNPLEVEDEGWTPPLPWPATTAQAVSADDEIPTPPPTVLVEQDGWTPPLPWAARLAAPLLADDEIPTAPVVSFAPDEDSGPLYVLSLPWWGGAFSPGSPPVVPIQDEDSWSIPAPQAEGFLYLVAPWAWGSAGDELPLCWTDEDAWQPPLPWPPTTAQAITADDETVTPPAVPPIQDEDSWQNPVPPQLWPTFLAAPFPLEQDEQAAGLVPAPIPSGTITLGGGGSPSRRVWPFTRTYEEPPAPPPAPVAQPSAPRTPPAPPIEVQPFADLPVAVPPVVPAPTVDIGAAVRAAAIAQHTAAAVRAVQAAAAKREAARLAKLERGPVVLVTRHWGGLGLAMLMARQGSDVVCAFDYTSVKADELASTEKCGDGLVEKLPLQRALQTMTGKRALWVFDGNDLPKEAERLRAKGELVIGTSTLSQRLEDDRDFAAAFAEQAGFALPLTEKFTDYAQAIAFLQQHRDQAFVYKPDKQDPTATYVPLGGNPAQANAELQAYLQSMEQAAKPSFIVQEVIDGIEANFELWLRDGVPVAAFCDLESKRKLVGDLGENVGCAGDYLFTVPLDSKEIRDTVGKYLSRPELQHYTGSVDINVMFHDGKPLFLENCFRFGYNAYPTIFHALATAPMEEILRQWLVGRGTCEHFFQSHIGGSLSLVVDHPKMGTPILVPPHLTDSVYLYRAYQDHTVAMVEGWSEVACVVGSGATIPDAGRACLELAKEVGIPGKGYRIDLAGVDLPSLPQSRYLALQQLGYFAHHPNDDEETMAVLLGVLA